MEIKNKWRLIEVGIDPLDKVDEIKEEAVRQAWLTLGRNAEIRDVFDYAIGALDFGIPDEVIVQKDFSHVAIPPGMTKDDMIANVLARHELTGSDYCKYLDGRPNVVTALKP